MAEPEPTREEWRKLYEAAAHVKQVAPWEWMEEVDIFGVRNPETGETGFVSVMGLLGEHLSVAVYLGARGLYEFWHYEQMAPFVPPESLLELPHLQASFEDRADLTDRDRQVVKDLGLKYRGRQAWPQFRSYRPGFFPWYLEGAEARFLAHALQQTVDVALRFREDRELLAPPGEDSYLVRTPHEQDGALVWEDRVETVPPVEPESIPIPMNVAALAAVKQLPRVENVLEVDFFLVPIPVGEKGERPRVPHMLLVVESESGIVVGSDLLEAEPSLQAMWGMVPLKLVELLGRLRVVPRQIRVGSSLLSQVLQPLAEELALEVKLTSALRSLAEAKESFMEMFVRRG